MYQHFAGIEVPAAIEIAASTSSLWIVALTAKLPASGRHRPRDSDRSNAGDDLDLEIETREPIDTEGGPSRIGRGREDFVLHSKDRVELLLGVGVEGGHINDVIQGATAGFQGRLKVGECQSHLRLEVGLGRTIAVATHMARDEKEIARSDGGGVRMLDEELIPAGRKHGVTCGHRELSCGGRGIAGT